MKKYLLMGMTILISACGMVNNTSTVEATDTVQATIEPTFSPHIITPEIIESATVGLFGPAVSGQLSAVGDLEIEDFPQYEEADGLYQDIVDFFREAWETSGQELNQIDWEQIEVQAFELNDQDVYHFIMYVPMVNGQAQQFLVVASNEAEKLVPVNKENLANKFVLLSSKYDEKNHSISVGIEGSPGEINRPVVEINLETGVTVLKGIITEGGEVSLGNFTDPKSAQEFGGQQDLLSLVGIRTELSKSATTELAKPGVYLRISVEGNWQIYDSEKDWVAWELIDNEWIKMYRINPEISMFNEEENYIPAEDLLDGTYYNFLNKVVAPDLKEWFQGHEGKIKTGLEMFAVSAGPDAVSLVMGIDTAPNFPDPETAPFAREVTFNHSTWEENGETFLYYVLPIFYYYKGEVYPVPVVVRIFGSPSTDTIIDSVNNTYTEKMNQTPIIIGSYYYGTDPLVDKAYKNIGSNRMNEIFERFEHGDLSALSDPGVVVLAKVASSEWYK